MCLAPIKIKNVNYGNKSKLSYLSDSTAYYILVPCGRCSVCLQLKQQYITQRVQMESFSHDLYFGTLTYNQESLPIHQVGDFKLAYADIADWQRMIKMIRKHEDIPNFRYMVVSEYGGKRHRPHFHFILSFPKNEKHTLADRQSFEIKLYGIFLKYWRRNYGSTRSPIWRPLCTYYRTPRSYNFDLHYLNPYASSKGLDDVAFYVSKYALKYDSWIDKLKSKLFFSLSESDYKSTWDIIRPRRLMSKFFGDFDNPQVAQHILKGIDLALHDSTALYPYFISPVNGQTFPLSPYYSKKYLRVSDMEVFNSRKSLLSDDAMVDTTPELTPAECIEKQRKFDIVRDYLDTRNMLYDAEDIDNTNDIHISNIYSHGQIKTASLMDKDFADCWEDY